MLNLPVTKETEEAMEAYIVQLLLQEKPLQEIQAGVKTKFAADLKTQLGPKAFEKFQLDAKDVRSVHHRLCDREKHHFECAGLFEDM